MFSLNSHEKMASSAGELLHGWDRLSFKERDLMKSDFYS